MYHVGIVDLDWMCFLVFQIQPPSMGSVLDMLNIINGILFVQISQQDIENFKMEFEKRQQSKQSTEQPAVTSQSTSDDVIKTEEEEDPVSESKKEESSSTAVEESSEPVC